MNIKKLLLISAILSSGNLFHSNISAATEAGASERPTLIITNRALPSSTEIKRSAEETSQVIGSQSAIESVEPVRVALPRTRLEDLDPLKDYFAEVETATSKRIAQLTKEYGTLEGSFDGVSNAIEVMQNDSKDRASEYYASVAVIQTELQAGSTPGNPRLLERLKVAQANLEKLSKSISEFNTLSVKLGDVSSVAAYLMQSVQATYGLTGAVKEDHKMLANLEDDISEMLIEIERYLNTVNEEITRASGYLAAERRNLRTLALAVANGDIYGANLSNRLYSQVNQSLFPVSATAPVTEASSLSDGFISSSFRPSQPQPLVVIRFDQPTVNYEQALFTAVGEAADKYPGAKFEIVAVDPGAGNAAKRAIESARAKRNAEKVMRSLVQMGLNGNDIVLSNASRKEARSSEVHVLLR